MKVLQVPDSEVEVPKSLHDVNPIKLTKWTKEPNINDLKYDLRQAQSSQSQVMAQVDYWERLYDAPKFGDKKHKGSRVNPKLIRKQAEWTAPALSEPFLSTSNLFEVKALTFEDVARAKQNTLLLNRQFSVDLNKTELVDSIIRALVKRGTCIVRTGWEYQEKEVIEDIEQFEYTQLQPLNIPPEMLQEQGIEDPYSQLEAQYMQLAQLQQSEPDSYEQLPSELKAGFEMSTEKGVLLQATSIGFKKEKIIKPITNKPTVDICDIKNVYIDPTCKGNLDKAQFVIHGFESSLSDLKKNGNYKNLDYLAKSIHDNTDSNFITSHDFRFADVARRKVIVYEYWGYWDIHGKGETSPIVATWVGDVLIRMEENPFPDGKPPFVVFNYIPDEGSVYGIPNAELLGDNQEILGAITRGMIDLMGKSANSQTGYAKNFLDATNKNRYLNGLDYEYNQGFDPRVHIHQHKYPEIPNSALTMVQMMNNEAESLSGVKAFSGTGISANSLGNVAVGIRGVLDAVSKREMSTLRRISDDFVKLGRKIMSMNSAFLSEQEVVRITNKEFVSVRQDDILGHYDLSISIATAEADDAKAKELSFMLQTIGNTLGQDIAQMMLSEIATLRKMPDLAKAIQEYKPEPDQAQQELQQLEMQRLQAEVELLKSQAQENMARAQVQQAKVGTEQARAENLQSQADSNSLDFAERYTGVTQENELNKQAMNNQTALDKERIKQDTQLNMQQNQMIGDMANQVFNIQDRQETLSANPTY